MEKFSGVPDPHKFDSILLYVVASLLTKLLKSPAHQFSELKERLCSTPVLSVTKILMQPETIKYSKREVLPSLSK